MLFASANHALYVITCCDAKCRQRAASFDAASESVRWREYAAAVVWNPLYWLTFASTVPLLVIGRRFHAIFGQHLPLSDHESLVEHEIRVWWIYPSDAAFLGGLGLEAAETLHYAFSGNPPPPPPGPPPPVPPPGDPVHDGFSWSALVVSVILYSTYIASNVGFLAAMRFRSSLHVRAFIAGNVAMAFGVLLMLIVTVSRLLHGNAPASVEHFTSKHSTFFTVMSWLLRAGLIIFLFVLSSRYIQLWGAYEEEVGLPQVEMTPNPQLPHKASPLAANDAAANLAHGGGGESQGAPTAASSPAKLRRLNTAVRRKMKHSCLTLVAAGSTTAVVFGLLGAACLFNTEGFWDALAP